jgi:dTDP-D-glucose 4,6-dehydratase
LGEGLHWNNRFVAQVTLDQGLKQTVEWYLANELWWRAVMDGSYAWVAETL